MVRNIRQVKLIPALIGLMLVWLQMHACSALWVAEPAVATPAHAHSELAQQAHEHSAQFAVNPSDHDCCVAQGCEHPPAELPLPYLAPSFELAILPTENTTPQPAPPCATRILTVYTDVGLSANLRSSVHGRAPPVADLRS